MARYVKDFPMVDAMENTYPQIEQMLTAKGYQYRQRDGEQVFQKGDGVWVAPSFVKVTYRGGSVRLEAWIDAMGAEQGLDGITGAAVKKPLKKLVTQIETILTQPREGFVLPVEEPACCAACGAQLKEGIKFCTACGTPVEGAADPAVISAASAGLPTDRTITKKEFLKEYAGESFYRNLRINSICGYVLCGIAALSALAMPFVLIDVAIFLGLTLGMHLGKSKGCAIGITVYAAFSMAYALMMTGQLAGWAWLIVGIYGIVIFNNAGKRYRELTKNQE